jgi:DNA adenine methylase
MISPLRYPGGKTRACKIIDDILNENFNIEEFDTIISPFFGGGSFEFYMQNQYGLKIIANDKFKPLYNFWKSCKSNNVEICDELYKKINTIDKEIFNELRKNIIDYAPPRRIIIDLLSAPCALNKISNAENDVKQAIMYFIINRCSFSGATLSGGFSMEASKKRFTKSSIDKIKNLNLNNFEISNKDFEEFLLSNCFKESKSIIFLDPPYYLNTPKLYGNNGDMHENFDHDRLYKCILNISPKTNWIMTYNNCQYIKDLYKNFKIIESNWSYGMNKSKKSSEIIILSN